MEKFDILHRGQTVTVTKELDRTGKKLKFECLVDMERGENQIFYENRVENNDFGWALTSTNFMNQSESTAVIIGNDGRVGYQSAPNADIVWRPERFNPDEEPKNQIERKAVELYEIIHSIYEHEQIGISVDEDGNKVRRTPKDIVELRKKRISNILELLGYSRLSDLKNNTVFPQGYLELSRIGDILERYRNLAFIRNEGNRYFDSYSTTLPKGITAEKATKMIVETESDVSADEEFKEYQDDYLERARGVKRDFLSGMQNKVLPTDWSKYSKMAKKTAELLMGLNADLIDISGFPEVKDLTNLQGNDLADKISELIDSPEFAEACEIEGRYAISEGREVVEKIEKSLQSEMVRSSTPGFALKYLADETKKIIDEKASRISNYDPKAEEKKRKKQEHEDISY